METRKLEIATWKSRLRPRPGMGMSVGLRSGSDKKEMISLIRTAVERGVTFFSTAGRRLWSLHKRKNSWAKRWLHFRARW